MPRREKECQRTEQTRVVRGTEGTIYTVRRLQSRPTATKQELRVTTIVILDIPATPQTRDKVLATLEEALVDTRAFDGCEGLELLVNQEDPANFVVWERWTSRDQYERYLAFRQASGFSASFRALFPDPPVIRKFDIGKKFD